MSGTGSRKDVEEWMIDEQPVTFQFTIDIGCRVWFNAYMFKHKKLPKLPAIALIIASLSLVIGLFVSLCVLSFIQSSHSADSMEAESHFQSAIRLAELEECYEHNIRPCSQETIAKYYEALPEEK